MDQISDFIETVPDQDRVMAMDRKPQRMEIQFGTIPLELVKENNWIVWRWEKRNGKWTKPPYQITGKPAKSNDSSTWLDFDSTVEAYNTGRWDDIGFMLNGQHVGLDWDDVRDSESGIIASNYLKKIKYINSYTEISPSGTGEKTVLRFLKDDVFNFIAEHWR